MLYDIFIPTVKTVVSNIETRYEVQRKSTEEYGSRLPSEARKCLGAVVKSLLEKHVAGYRKFSR